MSALSETVSAQHDPYFVQKVRVTTRLAGRSRISVFAEMCKGKRVLHVGCADWPITKSENSIHVQLEPHCAELDGIDLHKGALAMLRPHVGGKLTSRWEDVRGPYDLVLVPEVLEHVPSVKAFLHTLRGIETERVVITVPDAASCAEAHFHYDAAAEEFTEIVHPDHHCWFTPYTFVNTVSRYTGWQLQGELAFFNRISLLGVFRP